MRVAVRFVTFHNAFQPRHAIPTTKLRFVAENARNDLIIGHDAQFSEQICVSCKYKYNTKKTENALIAASASVFPSLVWSVTALPRHQGTVQRHHGTIQRLYSRNSHDRTTSDQTTSDRTLKGRTGEPLTGHSRVAPDNL